jgi:dehydrogenase/reductase SDR family protein 4
MSLQGKAVLVTGARQGLGKSISLGMAEQGADLIICDRVTDDGKLDETAREIEALGVKTLTMGGDITVEEDVNAIVEKSLEKFGKIDVLVNNAATNPTMASAIDIDERAWDSIMNLNLKGLFFLSQAVARGMKEQGGGVIVNVASIAGITPDILPVYSISKAGVIMATKVMAQQWAQYNIRVNAIAPGLTKTRFSEALWKNDDILKMAMSRTPMARPADPEEMAGAIIYLASDASSYVTGQVIAIDGGVTI